MNRSMKWVGNIAAGAFVLLSPIGFLVFKEVHHILLHR